jgi:Arc/MetJ-type ribon-helix-helix transcriptional regulator
MPHVGVRFNDQDLAALDRVRGFRTRSDAIRALVRDAARRAEPESKAMAELQEKLRAAHASARAEKEQRTDEPVHQARKLSTSA